MNTPLINATVWHRTHSPNPWPAALSSSRFGTRIPQSHNARLVDRQDARSVRAPLGSKRLVPNPCSLKRTLCDMAAPTAGNKKLRTAPALRRAARVITGVRSNQSRIWVSWVPCLALRTEKMWYFPVCPGPREGPIWCPRLGRPAQGRSGSATRSPQQPARQWDFLCGFTLRVTVRVADWRPSHPIIGVSLVTFLLLSHLVVGAVSSSAVSPRSLAWFVTRPGEVDGAGGLEASCGVPVGSPVRRMASW